MMLILDSNFKAPGRGRIVRGGTCLMILAAFFGSPAHSQALAPVPGSPPPAGQPQANTPSSERPVTSPRQVDPGQLNILPSAGSSGQSAAPTMIFDCKKDPASCTTPNSPGDKAADPPDTSSAPVTPPRQEPVRP